MYTHYRMFKSSMKTWTTILNEVSEFTSSLGPDRLINIMQSCDNNTAVVVVWYWDKSPPMDKF